MHAIVSTIIVFLSTFTLITEVTPAIKCATLYNSVKFQGTPYTFIEDAKQDSVWRTSYYVPNSVRVTPGCSLTIFDYYGTKQTLEKDDENLGWMPYQLLDRACCQCGGCNGVANNLGNLCARIFENPSCGTCSGYRLDLKDGDGARNFGILNNRMSSVAVRAGCTLNVFSAPEFGGWRFNYTESNNLLDDRWIRQISSAKCGCIEGAQRPPVTLPTIPTQRPPNTLPTRPPITLPTVPTTRPPNTLPTWPPVTLPTVPTTRPPITLPTVPTTRPPITLPTVPTTRPPITLPTVPTTRPPITLPTVPTTTFTPDSDEYSESDEEDFFGAEKSDEVISESLAATTTTIRTVPTTTTKKTVSSSSWAFSEEEETDEVKGPLGLELEKDDDEDDDYKKEEEDDDWDDW